MHLQALTPLMTSLALTIVCGICARSHHQVSDDADTFTISPVVGYMMIGGGIFFCFAPLFPGAGGNIPTALFFWEFSPFWLFAFMAATFFFRYRVIVRDHNLTFGAFRRRVIPFSEVIDFDVVRGQSSSELRVYLKSGKRLTFSGMLSDFDELVGMVNSHMAGVPGAQQDSPAKIRDQEKRKRDSRLVSRIVTIGLLIVTVFVLIHWRTRLLH